MATNCWLVRPPRLTSCFQGGLASDERADAPGYQQVNDASGCRVQIVIDPSGAACPEPFDAVACPLAPQPGLELGLAPVVELVDRPGGPPVDDVREEARFV